MPQKQEEILPLFLNCDSAVEQLKPNESLFVKGMGWDINANPVQGIGSNNPTGEGQNLLKLTPTRSNIPVLNVQLPAGYNKCTGSFESVTTQDAFHLNFNSNGNHGIYILSGNTGLWQTVVIDPNLLFSDEQEAAIPDHRCRLRFVKDAEGNIIEKYLLITDGKGWQKYINVIAAIKSNGFDAGLYPYWKLLPPHFDRRELFEWPVRPPMYKPIASLLPNTPADLNKYNELVDTAFQFAYGFQNTDGRGIILSPYSLPIYVKTEDYLSNPDNLPKNIQLVFYAGSCMTEKIIIYVRQCKRQLSGITDLQNWGDWFKYDTINKFTDCGVNSKEVIGNEYWLRTDPWSTFNYDPILNTIKYVFDNSKQGQIISQEDALMIQNSMPQLSKGLSDLGDAMLLANNRYDYDNFPCDVTGKMDVIVKEKPSTFCPAPLRNIKMYAYVGYAADTFAWYSQVGYYDGADTQERFGGVYINEGTHTVTISIDISKTFSCDFADKSAFCLYLKGTPYYTVGKWYVVNSDNSLTKIDNLLDGSLDSTRSFIQSVFDASGYFVCLFELAVPAGRYNATIGRHNVSLSGDFRNTSTYIMGIANSRIKSTFGPFTVIKPDITVGALTSYSKEMEIDCTAGDIDTWGNGHDLFYIFSPSTTQQGNRKFRFIEGYVKESRNDPFPAELLPYGLNHGGADISGQITDKNGFYFANTKAANADVTDVEFTIKLNCAYPFVFSYPTSQSGSGWRVNNTIYLSDHNGNVVGDCNRIIYTGKITDLTGTIGYSNIGISIVDGSTVYTQQDGTFTLIAHNGQPTLRQSNVYVNAGGNFLITISNCGQIPLFHFSENNSPCINCQKRTYPFPLNLAIVVQNQNQTSLKQGGKYSVGFAVADLAGRLTFVNVIKEVSVPSFLQRNDILATYFQIAISGALQFIKTMPDTSWFSPYVSRATNILRFVEWVGDNVAYIDNNGQVVSDAASAVFVSITITSLYDYNVARNFSTLANYQFVDGDRVKILDNGDGQLFDTATYGTPIDLRILGTNYNQAAITAGLLPNTSTTPVINNNINTTTAAQQAQNTAVTILVPYDSRLDKLVGKTGFWIEIDTPAQVSDVIPFLEMGGFYPIINGEVAIFTGYSNGQPTYTYPTTIDIDFWDTYFLQRTITIKDVGNKFFAHPFESPNISDSFGPNITSGGRLGNVKNDNAKQRWLPGSIIKSDDFISEGLLNGLGTFRSKNKKDFGSYPYGGILAVIIDMNIICFICENDYFTTNYNFHYTYPNEQGVMITNLNNGVSEPFQKVGNHYGVAAEDTATVGFYDKWIWWYDRKNQGFIICDYRSAKDVSRFDANEGTQGYIQSLIETKTNFITNWNKNHDLKDRFDVITGIDMERNNIYLSFRPRRNNTNDLSSYVNQRRNWQTNYQETLVYNIGMGRWTRSEGFVPEAYGKLRGNVTGTQLLSFAAGKPYLHNLGNTSFNEFYGAQTEPIIMAVFNGEKELVKMNQSLSLDSNPFGWFVDLMYTNFPNSFSYLSTNKFGNKEQLFYAAILRNMNSYPNPDPEQLFRSMLQDGYRMVGQYLVFRLVGDPTKLNQYNELTNIYLLNAYSSGNKK